MAASNLPQQYRSIAHYIKIASEHKERDVVVYYWCESALNVSSISRVTLHSDRHYLGMYYACEVGMKIDKSSPECKKFLVETLDALEKVNCLDVTISLAKCLNV